ncbi:hydrolase [Amylibacter marinus]|uniref:Hydrolase n=1 Tax=Amylibacter marinus TaxID=1475483 RepID=A0ABQ5VWG1_9RHOB|nr:HAD family phosphatase [Amylibacter marinus]GLQ35605.1 hydrolase [Amylibacter marinus]
MTPKLIIFDCDGVLVDSELISNTAISQNLHRHGLTLTPRACMAHFTGKTMAMIGEVARDMGADLPRGWVDEIYGQIYQALAQKVQPIPHIFDVINWVKGAGLPLCVASNGSLEQMRISLGRTQLLPHFQQALYSAHSLGMPKPRPDLFLHAARQFNVDPSDCLVIEDSPSGALAAQRAGIPCFGFIRETPAERMRPLCQRLFTSMADLPNLIETTPSELESQ